MIYYIRAQPSITNLSPLLVNKAINWFYEEFNRIMKDIYMAKHPFQFLSYLYALSYGGGCYIPITQDASASAYQIMSYFFLDEILGMKTNLLPSKDGNINDIYSFILEELKEFLKKELLEESQDPRLSDIVCKEFDRKIVKSIFMPKIYGKTLMSTAKDLKNVLSHYLTHKECFKVARLCFKFWSLNYHKLENLSKLIGNIGWVAATRERPVYYKIPFYTTVQDYMKMEPINIWVYDRIHRKRRKVTLRVTSSKRDCRKTTISTFLRKLHPSKGCTYSYECYRGDAQN